MMSEIFDHVAINVNKFLPIIQNSLIEKPIFIIGTGRCGSTLLHNILKSNKHVCIYPTEANKLWHPKTYPYSKKSINTPPIIIDPEQFTQLSIQNWPKNHIRILNNVFSLFYLLNVNKKIFIVKSAMISFMIPTILSIYKDALFIHLYRNGISVADSLFKKEEKKYSKFKFDNDYFLNKCADYWVKCIEEIDKQDRIFSLTERKKIFQFSYEDLCLNPIKKITDLSDFIDCKFKEFKFDYTSISNKNFKVGNYQNICKWKQILGKIEPTMLKKGYV